MDDLVDGTTEKLDGLADQVALVSKSEAKSRQKLNDLLKMQAQELSESLFEEGKRHSV